MSYNQTHPGAGAIHATTTQTSNLRGSLLNMPFPSATTAPAPPGRQLDRLTHPCTWPGCPRFFACPHNVRQHIREKHTHEKPYQCELCAADGVDTAFSRPYGLTRHRAQIHKVGKKPSRIPNTGVGYVAGAPEAAAPMLPLAFTPQTIAVNDEFTEMRAVLGRANAGMDVDGSNFEMSHDQSHSDARSNTPDDQFHFDAPSNTQLSRALSCGECEYVAVKREELVTHMHAAHQVPNSRFCTCNICTMMYITTEGAANDQAAMLGEGGFRMDLDGDSFAVAGSADYPSNNDPALLSFFPG